MQPIVIGFEIQGKRRTVYFSTVAHDSLARYWRARRGPAPLTSRQAFARHDRGTGNKVLPLSTRAVQIAFTHLVKHAGTECEFTPHTCCHLVTTCLYNETGDITLVQEFLGHSDPRTTSAIYARQNDARVRAAYRAAFG